MSKFFYTRLAINNIKKNSKTYIPYILTCIGTIVMFYNMCFLVVAKDIGSVSDSGTLRYLLLLGVIVIGVFSVIFLFYTNSFLIKQRKKEFGLFNILGMEKKHIAKIMFFEALFIAFISIVVGIIAGIILSKLVILFLLKIISFEATFGFEVPMKSVVSTIVVFAGIFVLNFLNNIFQVHLSKPIELLKGGNVGEKEPKTKWVLALIGAVCLTAGYYISLTTESPIAAINLFFFAVILVIIGTYCLFTAGSIVIFKALRKNKKYYYKLNHFISVSGMIYRMKQNAVGLANICILSTMVIVMLSSTLSLYIGMEDVLRTRFPQNIAVNASNVSNEQAIELDKVIEKQAALANITPENSMRYRYMNFVAIQNGASFSVANAKNNIAKLVTIEFITIDDYNTLENENKSLENGEVLLYTLRGDIPDNTISFNGFELLIKERLTSLNSDGSMSAVLSDSYYIIVNDINVIEAVYNALNDSNGTMGELAYYYGFDVNGDKDIQINLVTNLRKAIKDIGAAGNAEGAESSRASFYSLYGGLFFLGIFLGILFIMATVLIIYYKQIAEGYDDKERFKIMQKVGMSHVEVKRAIKSQVLTVFFLPLITAIIHIAFAFKVITKLLSVLNLTNIPLFAICTGITILVFAAFYIVVYTQTARTYYKIVS